MIWAQLLHALVNRDGIPWSMLKEYRHSNIDGQDTSDYFNTCKLILMKLDNSAVIDGREGILDDIILKSQPAILTHLVTSLSTITVESYQRDKLVDLISKFIHIPNHLEKMMLGVDLSNNLEMVQLLNAIINIPSIVSNAMKLKTSLLFMPINYFKRICQATYNCLQKLHSKFKHNQDYPISFLTHLSGRICFNGHYDLCYDHLLAPILNLSQNNLTWQKVGYTLVSGQSDGHLENVIKPIFRRCSDPVKINFILKDLILKSDKLKYLLTNKFVIISYFNEIMVFNNIVHYVLNQSQDLLITIICNLLEAWSNGSSLKYRNFDQQFYISSSLIICCKYLNLVNLDQVKTHLIKLVVYGMEVYLKAVQNDIRTTGLYVGQVLISKLHIDGPKLDFKIEENDQVRKLKDLLSSQPMSLEQPQADFEHLKESEDEKDGEDTTEDEEQSTSLHVAKNSDLDSDDDEDDDLVPYNLSNDTRTDNNTRPIYLRDVISGLQDTNNPDWFKICLENASIIIERNQTMLEEVAVDFTRTLLCLNNDYDLKNFDTLRQDAMVKLCCFSPVTVSKFLTSQFYLQNYVIRQRLDILEVLASASQKLSSPSQETTKKKSQEAITIEDIFPKDMVLVEKQWKSMLIVPRNLKTKVVSTRKEVKVYVNQFSSVAGYFFFPLMKSFDKPDITFDLIEEDYFVLGRLLYTLGLILNSAALSPISRQMGEALMQFLWVFRYHTERQVILNLHC